MVKKILKRYVKGFIMKKGKHMIKQIVFKRMR
ncbi:hypothetical protein N783_08835 [Pontibacillus marinus BH030004 = DSM 16465]|uniref:Uncharacterized protein n=1 Tax=Pontibacillus marinus BH030004 = DSM 16465 TaxID=1385511 RepID=A0A0A5G4N7_9BACI|nr:hypothetical protein N783_08835 [Pontibacillus marinus BH030004 = DSM 16465]